MATSWITRTGSKSFRFKDTSGQTISNKTDIDYFKSLGIPPAWENVRIATTKQAKILATGIDSAGRKQYVYNPDFRAKQEQMKFERIIVFARALPKMRQTVDKDLKRRKLDYHKVMATIVSIMDRTYIRIGNDTYAKDNQSYGLTTLRSRHTTVSGNTITFDFIGKSGKHHTQRITEPVLARIVKQLDNLPGYEVFKYYNDQQQLTDVKSTDVNAYIKEIMGEEFSAKDFRTWAGTLIASAELAVCERAGSERERKKSVTECVHKVARQLGNTPAVARKSYIDPRVIEMFMTSNDLRKVYDTIIKMKHKRGTQYLSPEERYVMKVLQA